MILDMFSKLILCFCLGIICLFACLSQKDSGSVHNKKVNSINILKPDSMSVAFRAVNNSKMKKFYYDFYALEPWSTSGLAKSAYIDSILQEKRKSIPTLICYMSSDNDSMRIIAYQLLADATGMYSGYMYYVKDSSNRKMHDSVQTLYLKWWENGGYVDSVCARAHVGALSE
jgi:hypothetical protein